MTNRLVTATALPALALAALGLIWWFGGFEAGNPGGIPEPASPEALPDAGPATHRMAPQDSLLHAPRFEGRIIDQRGHPHAGVEVQLCGTQLPPEVLTTARSDVSGRFVLRPDRAACSHRYRVRARVQEGFPWQQGPILDPVRREILRLADLSVPRPADLEGRVLDPQNRALAGLTLTFLEAGRRTILQDESPGKEVRTDPRGRFHLRLPAGVPYRILILAPQRYQLKERRDRTFPPGAQSLLLRTEPLAHSDLQLRFWTWNRRPHPGVRHRVLPDPEEGFVRLEACSDQPLPSIQLQTRLQIPRSGIVDVYMPQGARLALQPHPLLPGTHTVQLRFQYLGARSGREPAPPLASRPEGRFQAPLHQGEVLLQELLPGRWRFWIQTKGLPESRPVEVLLPDGGIRSVRSLLLVGTARLTGRLLDARGQPVASARLRIYAGSSRPGQRRAPNQGWIAQIRTDAHGRFRFLGLPLVSYQLWTRRPGGRENRLAEGRLLPGPNPPLKLVLQD